MHNIIAMCLYSTRKDKTNAEVYICVRLFVLGFVCGMYVPSSQKQLRAGKNKTPGFRIFSLLDYESNNLWDLEFFVTCCCGLCVPKLIITKANAKDHLGGFICLSIARAKAKTISGFSLVICGWYLDTHPLFTFVRSHLLQVLVFVSILFGPRLPRAPLL